MILILQVAAGIVLAFAIISYRHSLMKVGKTLGILSVAALVFVIIVMLAGVAIDTAQPLISKNSEKIGTGLFAIVGFMCFLFGSVGVNLLFESAKGRWSALGKEDNIWPVGIANVLLTGAAFALLKLFEPSRQMLDGIDNWSRAAGYKDAGAVGVFCIALLWPWAALAFRRLIGIKPEPQGNTAE